MSGAHPSWFEVPVEPEAFVARVRAELRSRGADHLIGVELEGEALVVRVSKLGRSELRYRLIRGDGGFRAELTRQKLAPLHAPFRHAFEERLAQAVTQLGGEGPWSVE